MTEIRAEDVTDRDVYVTRAFDAPRDVVWKFFTEPAYLAQWFGPTGVHVSEESVNVDLRVGGSWNLTMVNDDNGEQYPIVGSITVCEPPEYLEINSGAQTAMGELADVIIRLQFHDHGDKTRVTLHQGPFTGEQLTATQDGWELSFVRLDEVLAG